MALATLPRWWNRAARNMLDYLVARFQGVALPFLTLDAEPVAHSGAVLIVCADPRVVAGVNAAEPSRIQHLTTKVRNEPPQGQMYGLSPHVIAVTCPPRIVGEGAQQGPFVDVNAPVLAGASHIVVESHNGCAGLRHFYQASLEKLARQGSETPYFDLQRQLFERGIERFARRVAALSKQSLVVEANHVDFGPDGLVVAVTNIRTVQLNGAGQGREPGILLSTGSPVPSLYGTYQGMSDYAGFQPLPGDGASQNTPRRRRWSGAIGNRRSR
jgi:hypothetical protein